MRGASYPASKTIRMSRSPGFHRPISMRSVTTRRTWAAVTSATSSAGPSRSASRI